MALSSWLILTERLLAWCVSNIMQFAKRDCIAHFDPNNEYKNLPMYLRIYLLFVYIYEYYVLRTYDI